MTSLRDLRRALGHEIDDLEVHTIASATTTTVTVAALVDASTGASAKQYSGAYLYNPVGLGTAEGQQVQALTSPLTPSTGVLAFDPAWSAPNAGTDLEISNLFPAIGCAGAQTDSRAILGRALAKMVVPRTVTVAIIAGADTLSVATYQRWLDRTERLVRVREPSPVGGAPIDAAWRRPQLILSGVTPTLQFDVPFGPLASGVLTLDVLAPADTFVAANLGAYAESTTGLVLDVDEAKVSIADFLPFGLYEVYVELAHRSPGVPNGNWSRKATEQLAICMQSKFWDVTSQRPQPVASPDQQQQPAGVGAR